MTQSAQPAYARQVEFAIRRLNTLSTLPSVAIKYFSILFNSTLDIAALTKLIETDAALTAKFLSLPHTENLICDDKSPAISQIIEKLPAKTVRDAVLSIGILPVNDFGKQPDKVRTLPGKELAIHNLAVACCAKSIAQTEACKDIDPETAYTAGLLHDIGKLALDEVMPKSFGQIIEQAEQEGKSCLEVEQEQLGIDHSILGKRLLQKWHLPGSQPRSITPSAPKSKALSISPMSILERQFTRTTFTDVG